MESAVATAPEEGVLRRHLRELKCGNTWTGYADCREVYEELLRDLAAVNVCFQTEHSVKPKGEGCRLVSSYLPAKKGEAAGDKEGVHCNVECETSGVVPGIQARVSEDAYLLASHQTSDHRQSINRLRGPFRKTRIHDRHLFTVLHFYQSIFNARRG
ncbi:hypothetical protein HPB50_010964 [Hyalomma asiaticum]|uniref:Uncharacterized protein n=1 Tax=Hyalomma asiaticum TaxID=266040 RepID=A0ACB7S8C6_HYAAI|nr:hypothetical protein HPB50_010964 [Hyalomma asiaticum]